MTPRGEKQSPPVTRQRTIYVSTAGNIFIKSTEEPGGTNGAEMAPGDKTPTGGAREVHFVGGRLVAIAQIGSSAGKMTISFDPSYSSCTVDMAFGRPAGEKVMLSGKRGKMVELLSVTFSGQRCSIRDGNAFAS
jgi:hypothetical protein